MVSVLALRHRERDPVSGKEGLCSCIHYEHPRGGHVEIPPEGAVSSFNKAVMERIFSCPCELFFCHDTLQFDDYSRYDNRIFDPAHKLEHHKTVFPKDLERARALGRMLVS